MISKCYRCVNNPDECTLEPDLSGCCKGFQCGPSSAKPTRSYSISDEVNADRLHQRKRWTTLKIVEQFLDDFLEEDKHSFYTSAIELDYHSNGEEIEKEFRALQWLVKTTLSEEK